MVQAHKHLHGKHAEYEATAHPSNALQQAVSTALLLNEQLQLGVVIVLAMLQEVMH
jgi:hypothetical protein